MTKSFEQRLSHYAKTHKTELRALYFILAFWFVWSQAANIHDFYTGFLEGFAKAL